MQKLHLVGFTTDLDGLILSARKGSRSGSFVLALDEALVEAMVDAVRRREDEAEGGTGAHGAARLAAAVGSRTRPDSALSVREMQDRLRAGASIDDVAAEAGVDADWVARFAPPVQAEQARVVERARQVFFDKPRVGQSRLPLGDAVARNVLGKGVHLSEDDFDAGWSAHLLPGGLWAIRFTYVSRGREQEAMWVLDPEEDDLSAGNRLASQLGYAASARLRKAPGPRKKKAAANKAGGRRRAAKKATAKKATAKKKAATRRATTRKASTRRATPRKASRKKASAKKAAPSKAAARKGAPKKASAKKAAAKKAAAKKAAPRRGARARTPRRSSGDRGAGGREAPPAPPPAPRFVVPAADPAPRPAPAPFRPAPPPVERRPAARPVNPPSRLVPVPSPAPPASAPPPSDPPRTPPPPVRRAAPVIRADRAAGAPAAAEGDGAAPPPEPPRRRLRRRREPLRAR